MVLLNSPLHSAHPPPPLLLEALFVVMAGELVKQVLSAFRLTRQSEGRDVTTFFDVPLRLSI